MEKISKTKCLRMTGTEKGVTISLIRRTMITRTLAVSYAASMKEHSPKLACTGTTFNELTGRAKSIGQMRTRKTRFVGLYPRLSVSRLQSKDETTVN